MAQGPPLLSTEDKFSLQRRLAIPLDHEAICRLTETEATRLHRLIRAGDAADVRAYLDNVILDQVFDISHHLAHPDRCRNLPR